MADPILVADDDSQFRSYLATLLSSKGYECRQAETGQQALEQLRTERHALVIADLHMPGNEELQFLKALKDEAIPTEVILVTGNPTVESALKAHEISVIAYLQKPFGRDQLLKSVEVALTRAALSAELSRTRSRLEAWRRDIGSLEQLLSMKPDTYSDSVPVDAYITLTIQNILEPLFDLKQLAETLAHGKSDQSTCHLFSCPRLDSQTNAIRHAVKTLEHTKSSFKSKELGELRKRLDKFLQIIEE